MLMRHMSADDKIYICADVDCDGFTSAALFINYLYKWNPTIVENNLIYDFHLDKTHGIPMKQIPKDTTLIVAIDASSNEFDLHQQLADEGIEVLCVDHHIAPRVSEYACVINNQLCAYKNKDLSGAGMIYRFCQYLDLLNGTDYADSLIDLAMCGIVGDMMSMKNFETKYIIEEGIKNITNPFISALVKKNSYSIGNTITPIGIAFYIAPYINAICRSGEYQDKKIVFESMLDFKAHTLVPSTKRGHKGEMEEVVEQAIRTCFNVKRHQTKERDCGQEYIEELIKEKDLLKHKVLMVQIGDYDLSRNLFGLVANELAAKYQRPTCVLKYDKNHEAWTGSLRGYDKSDFKDFRGFLEESQLVEYAQGHANAAGVGIKDENIQKLIDYCDTKLAKYDFSSKYLVDFIFSGGEFNSNVIYELGSMKELYGQDITEPLIAIENLRLTRYDVSLLSKDKNPTLKITLPNGIECIRFKSSEEEFEKLCSSPTGCVNIALVGTCDINEWNGNVKPQIKIKDYDIIDCQEYYF